MNRSLKFFGIGLVIGVALLAAWGWSSVGDAAEMSKDEVVRAVAVLHPTAGNSAKGTVWFSRTKGGVLIKADVQGLAEGKHGFHIHELGDCSAADGTSAGGHYNPDGNPHAGPQQKQRHMGDLGNIESNSSGQAQYERVDDYVTLQGEKSIIGRAVIIHSGEDDLTSQPTGNAGSRVACGVIGIAAK